MILTIETPLKPRFDPNPKRLFRAVQFLFLGSILLLLWNLADGEQALDLLTDAAPLMLLATLAALSLQTILSALRWRIDGPNVLENTLKKCASTHTSPDNLPFYTLQNLENTHARVLLVEDNDINQVVAKSILENLDLVVDIANNGQEALSLLMEKEDRYHAILMDCQMPVLDGYSATKLIRSMPEYDLHKYTPIIALTANVMEGDEEKCLTAGMNSFVTKPINTERLKEELEKWF